MVCDYWPSVDIKGQPPGSEISLDFSNNWCAAKRNFSRATFLSTHGGLLMLSKTIVDRKIMLASIFLLPTQGIRQVDKKSLQMLYL